MYIPCAGIQETYTDAGHLLHEGISMTVDEQDAVDRVYNRSL